MGTERLKPLHNFTLPCDLRWGSQKQLRCMKVNNPTTTHHHRRGSADEGIAAVREKVMFDLHTAAENLKESIFKEGLEEGEIVRPTNESERPWNLRTRRAACANGGRNSGEQGLRLDLGKNNTSSSMVLMNKDKSCSRNVAERPKFSLSLSKKEIEQDFAAFGVRLPRRPKKRPKTLQKQLDTLFPGVWMTEVTPDMYKVQEPAP